MLPHSLSAGLAPGLTIGVFAVTAERPGRGKLAETVTDHLLGDEDRHVRSSVVDSDRVSDHVRVDGAGPRPRANHPALVATVQKVDLLAKIRIDEWTLLRTSNHGASVW